VEEWLRALVVVAFTGLLVLLRFDAHRFAAAEYDDELDPRGWRSTARRFAWYGLGLLLAFAIWQIHSSPVVELNLGLGENRTRSLTLGLGFGIVGTLVAAAFAWFRYRRFRFPAARYYPGAFFNSIGTAVIDEVCFRGAILGLLIAGLEWPIELAIAGQAVLYALATRLGAPGRSRIMLAIFLCLGLVAAYLTIETGGIGAAVVGHAITRFAIFTTTGHAGQVRPLGEEPEEEEAERLPPDGWEVVRDTDR
jgi:hypothetical protein